MDSIPPGQPPYALVGGVTVTLYGQQAGLLNLAVVGQGGACGAAGPASAPGSAFWGGPPGARRATPARLTDQTYSRGQAHRGCAQPASSRPIVPVAATASMAALVAGLVLRTADHGAIGNRHDWLQGTRRVLYGITAETSSCRTSTGASRASSARRRCRPPAASLNNHEVRRRAPRTPTQHGNPNTAT